MEVAWQKDNANKRVSQQSYDLNDLKNDLGINTLSSSLGNVGNTIVSTEEAMKAITPLANYVGNNWKKIVLGFLIASVITSVVAGLITNAITKK